MQLKGMKWFAKLLVMVLAVWLAAVPVTGTQAVLADGVYDIAVLQVGNWSQWTEDDFLQLEEEPGVESYTWTAIPTSALTETGLATYDVLIVPHQHDYSWLDSPRADNITAWVNGGKLLIVHSYWYRRALNNDPLMAAFGSDYRVDWTGLVESDRVRIVDSTNPLVSTPNILYSDNLSFWQRGVLNSINWDTHGSAWKWAVDTWATENHWLGYALSGSGAIVVLGGFPETHSTYPYLPYIQIVARWLIENEITLIVPEESVTEVEIDVKPGSSPNSINPDSKGIIPVAILTTDAFDATTVNATTVTFGPSAATMVHKKAHLEDVDGDGDTDMLLHFKIQDSGIKAGDTEAELTGNTLDGEEIHGVDSIRTVGKEDG